MNTFLRRPLNERGVGGLELLMTIVVVLVMAGVGTYVYTRQHSSAASKKTALAKTTGTANSSAPGGVPAGASGSAGSSGGSGSSSGSGGNSTSTSENTIKVESGGFQITVPNNLKDLTWHSVSSGGVITTTFSTGSLTASVPACAADKGSGAFDTIQRGSGQYPGPANASSGGLLKQYGNYYLAYVLPTGPCAKNLTADQQALVDSQAETFYDTLSTVSGL